MDPRLCSWLPAPGGLRPLPVRGRGECVRARACAQVSKRETRDVPGLAGGRLGGGGTWLSWCVYEGVAGCAGARSPVRARLHGLK